MTIQVFQIIIHSSIEIDPNDLLSRLTNSPGIKLGSVSVQKTYQELVDLCTCPKGWSGNCVVHKDQYND